MSFADIRTLEHVPGKSINLAMSIRGLSALNSIGLGNHVAEEYGIPMRARMIHRLDGTTYPVPYGKKGQAIYSVGRRYVNEILLNGKPFILILRQILILGRFPIEINTIIKIFYFLE